MVKRKARRARLSSERDLHCSFISSSALCQQFLFRSDTKRHEATRIARTAKRFVAQSRSLSLHLCSFARGSLAALFPPLARPRSLPGRTSSPRRTSRESRQGPSRISTEPGKAPSFSLVPLLARFPPTKNAKLTHLTTCRKVVSKASGKGGGPSASRRTRRPLGRRGRGRRNESRRRGGGRRGECRTTTCTSRS